MSNPFQEVTWKEEITTPDPAEYVNNNNKIDEAFKRYRDDDTQGWAIDNRVLLSKAQSMGHNLVALAGVNRPKYIEYPLVSLNEHDKKFVKNVKLKQDEYIFRLIPSKAVHGEMPLVKVNLNRGLIYFLTDRAMEEDIADFETRGTKLSFLRYLSTSKIQESEFIQESIGNLTNISDKVLKDLYKEAKGSKDKEAKDVLKDIKKEMKNRGIKESTEESLDEEYYKQTFRNGDVSWFKSKEKLKNGKYKGLLLDVGASGRSKKKPKNASVDVNGPMWKKASENEVPDVLKESVYIQEDVDFQSIAKRLMEKRKG